MAADFEAESELRFTDQELEVFGEFSEAARDGKNPDVEDYLRRVPGSAEKMRPILVTVTRLVAELGKLRAEFPDVDLGRLLGPNKPAPGG
jgi:hypothetical protein